MSSKGPLESVIVSQILKFLRSLPDCYAIKTHGSQFSVVGTPDVIGSFEGHAFVLEAKRPGCTPTPAQMHQLSLWAGAGALAQTVHGVDDVRRVFALVGWV